MTKNENRALLKLLFHIAKSLKSIAIVYGSDKYLKTNTITVFDDFTDFCKEEGLDYESKTS